MTTILTMMTISTMMIIWTMMTISKMMTIVFVVKLEVVSKQVGGYLIPYSLQPPCVRKLEVIGPDARALPRRLLKLITITHSVTYVGIKLLGQLKKSTNTNT